LTPTEDDDLPPPDDELPPPPDDTAEEAKSFREIKVKRSGVAATLKRAFTIFEKDVRSMAKHGLIGSIISIVFLTIIFGMLSTVLATALRFDIGDMFGGGDSMRLPNSDDMTPPVADAGDSISVVSGTSVVLDASASYDDVAMLYYVWSFREDNRDIELYGKTVEHTFYTVGTFNINLMVADSSWNTDEALMTVEVTPATDDHEPPTANAGSQQTVDLGATIALDGSNSTDNILVTNWTWIIRDYNQKITRILYGVNVTYLCENAGYLPVELFVRDESGNSASSMVGVDVNQSGSGMSIPYAGIECRDQASVGEEVALSTSIYDNSQTIVDFIWYLSHNDTTWIRTGETSSFTAEEQGLYEVMLVVRDDSGFIGVDEATVVVYPEWVDPNVIEWTSVPFGVEEIFGIELINLLTYAYGIAMWASISFVGGLFAKGFAHEINKGTIKILFFGPISVTTMILSKILYPMILAPFFIFPLMIITMSPFHMPLADVLLITVVAYGLSVVTMIAAAFGSCMIYATVKRLIIKPSSMSRIFLYLSLLGTLFVSAWLSKLFDMLKTQKEYLSFLPTDFGGWSALSPFHQGGMFLSNFLTGTEWTLDLWTLLIPAVLIIGGVVASKWLYGDIFSRE
jgi:hypothetical protein